MIICVRNTKTILLGVCDSALRLSSRVLINDSVPVGVRLGLELGIEVGVTFRV